VKWDGCDAVIHLGILGRHIFVNRMIESTLIADKTSNRQLFEKIPQIMSDFEFNYNEKVVRLMEKYGKPVLGVSLLSDKESRTITDIEGSYYKGVSFLTPERTVKALAGMYSYKQWLNLEGVSI